ncbi:hypothetical protein Q9Q95_04400 [Sphingomonas sp. DG1-23]|uniref:hypothetical protein n=1 Tax=Sphingomonas sp. DG1-23 TaxID=3068316 RepID=UPI00273E74B5|nr:hypothetical protein [Sphingomonas sp. DG1-23]MDP5278155.1 hypothetical protein [Sphingomonas sp. DG1-23]
MARVFTRQAFYELVWSKPITHVAKDFALSDVAVHKICRKHDIPTPPLGWWAKKQAGKPVKQTPLPDSGPGVSDRIVIAAPVLGSEPSTIATIREEARLRVSGLSTEADADAVPDPIVAQTIATLRKAKPSAKGVIEVSGAGLIRCEIGPASVDRLETILSRIVAAAAAQGFILQATKIGAGFFGDGETISVGVTETVKRVKHVLTANEQKEMDAWERKAERRYRNPHRHWEFEMRPIFDEWDYVCTGQIGFEMESVHVLGRQGPRSTFRDAKVQRLDSLAEDISVALAVLAVAKREERMRREEAERVRLEEKRVREQPLRAKFIEDRRREGLEAVLADIADLDRLRRLLRGLDAIETNSGSRRVAVFLAWARDELAAREQAFSAEGLEHRFEEARLFGDDDDHSFKSPYWY